MNGTFAHILSFVELLGGLGLFLYGMRVMSDGLQKRAGARLQKILRVLTIHPIAGVATGLMVTSVIQSSSATTVLLVSIVNAGLMGLEQSIGVIMGANIGTTFTAWLVSILGFKFKITALALPAIALGMPLFFSRREKRRETAAILIGFGILFLGLGVMKDSVPDIRNNPDILAFLQHFAEPHYPSVILFIIFGTLLTICVQSSSAALAITLTMAYKGWITFPVAAAIVLGENIGTTITAFLASLGMNVNARRAARAHMVFNLIGVLWMLAVFFPFIGLLDKWIPGDVSEAKHIPIHLSAFHSCFNIVNTALMILFVPQLARLVKWLVPDGARVTDTRHDLPFVASQTSEDVESNLISAMSELGRMSDMVKDMLLWVLNALQQAREELKETKDRVSTVEATTDEIEHRLSGFLTRCMVSGLSESQANRIRGMYRIAHELEATADGCKSVARALLKRQKKGAEFHETGTRELGEFTSYVIDFLAYNADYLSTEINDFSLEQAVQMEKNLNRQRSALRKLAREKLSQGVNVRGEMIFLDVVSHLEQMGDHCYNISQEIISMNQEE